MPGSQHGPSIKNANVYEALRRKGYSKEKSARISNAQVSGFRGKAGFRGKKGARRRKRRR